MSDIITTIKKAALEAVKASSPSNLVFGKIESFEPVSVCLEEKISITGKFLCVGTVVQQLIENEKINIGDRIILLKQEGGQKFFAMDALVDK